MLYRLAGAAPLLAPTLVGEHLKSPMDRKSLPERTFTDRGEVLHGLMIYSESSTGHPRIQGFVPLDSGSERPNRACARRFEPLTQHLAVLFQLGHAACGDLVHHRAQPRELAAR